MHLVVFVAFGLLALSIAFHLLCGLALALALVLTYGLYFYAVLLAWSSGYLEN